MRYTTIISAAELQDLLADGTAGAPLLLDCRFDLAAPDAGEAEFSKGHLPGAHYIHLDRDLAAPPSGSNGRHPLPDRSAFAARLRALGLTAEQQVVVYDSNGGAWAARAWWLLRWAGHSAVAVLDGGLPAWIAQAGALESGTPVPEAPGDFTPGLPLVAGTVSADDVLANISAPDAQVLDARDPSRFRGDPNPLDPVAGHIPGAKSRFFRDNLTADGRFRPAAELRADFAALLGENPAILQCGSGVTACHNALAMEIAGLPGAFLYPGSWSEWISDRERPVATGA